MIKKISHFYIFNLDYLQKINLVHEKLAFLHSILKHFN